MDGAKIGTSAGSVWDERALPRCLRLSTGCGRRDLTARITRAIAPVILSAAKNLSQDAEEILRCAQNDRLICPGSYGITVHKMGPSAPSLSARKGVLCRVSTK